MGAEHDFRRSVLGLTGRSVRKFRVLGGGRYRVEGRGAKLSPGDTLLLSLANAQAATLRLSVRSVREKAIPPGAWVVDAEGPDLAAHVLLSWPVRCDACADRSELEFLGPREGTAAEHRGAAAAALKLMGWQARPDGTHHCPNCHGADVSGGAVEDAR